MSQAQDTVAPPAAGAPYPNAWAAQRERGDARLVNFMVWLTLGVGRRAGQVLLYPIALYFFLASAGARQASRGFLRRATGRPVGRLDVLRHIACFASVIFDRVFMVTGRLDDYRIDVAGLDHLQAALAQQRGCILLGAHVGSFEVLRAIAPRCKVPARALMYRANGGTLTALLDRLNPELCRSVIEIGDVGAMLRAREALERGEMIGILADRGPGGDRMGSQRTVQVDFLGAPAPFPTGPMVLAGVLGVPAVLFFGLRTGPRRYEVRFQPFADQVVLRRETRQADLRHWIARYAAMVGETCRAHPYNWFNFYDFWGQAPDASDRLAGDLPGDRAGPGAGLDPGRRPAA